jgi:hypothetical protein
MSISTLHPALSARPIGPPDHSPVQANDARRPPAFSRPPVPADPFGIRDPSRTTLELSSRPYDEEPYPNAPSLAAGTLVDGRLPDGAYAKEALCHDLKRLGNDLSHGRVDKASERLERMARVDMAEHMKNFHVDPELFAKLRDALDRNPSTPLDTFKAARRVMMDTGAMGFMNFPRSRS